MTGVTLQVTGTPTHNGQSDGKKFDRNTKEEKQLDDNVLDEKEQLKPVTTWRQRQDVLALVGGLLFIFLLIGTFMGIGHARGWDANSGYTHNTSATSPQRFLPEPFVPVEGVPGRYGNDRTARWYYWRVPPSQTSVWTHLFPWVGYLLHQILVWATIYHAQMVKAEEPLGKSRYRTTMHKFNWISLGLNVFFHLLHLLNTHTTYDATAPDVSISTSQSSVIMLLVLIVILEYKERGLFFGWPAPSHKSAISTKLRLDYGPINVIRRYHGYAFAWGAIYTFWYHPMENTWGHALGFFHTWIIMLQGSLMYQEVHLNKYWRLLQEVFVCIHGGVVASQTGGPDLMGTSLWPMFVFGFCLCFVLTQIHGLPFWSRLPKWTRVAPLLLYVAVVLWSYSWIPDSQGRTWIRLQEVIRIPAVYYLDFFVGWAVLLAFLAIEKKVKVKASDVASSPWKRTLWVMGAVLVYGLHVALAIVVQQADWKTGLIVQMILFTIVYTVGSVIAFMFLKQVIPQRVVK